MLCSDFKQSLEQMKLNAPIVLTSTKVSTDLLTDFNIERRNGKIQNLLFLARVERTKGIFITLDAFALLKKRCPYLKLFVCGSGGALEEAKLYVKEQCIEDVTFCGNISGKVLKERFANSDIYMLPTHGEGMATSVLEAMAFGLPILSRPVGGVKDFFMERKMGVLTESLNPADYAAIVEEWIESPGQVKAISILNHEYAKKHFLASVVAEKYEKDIELYCKNS